MAHKHFFGGLMGKHANTERDSKNSLIIPLSQRFYITLHSLAALSKLAWWFCSLTEIFDDGWDLFRSSVILFMEQTSSCSTTVSSSDSSESNLMWLVELPESRSQNKVKVSRQSHYDLGRFARDFANTVILSVLLFSLDGMLQQSITRYTPAFCEVSLTIYPFVFLDGQRHCESVSFPDQYTS